MWKEEIEPLRWVSGFWPGSTHYIWNNSLTIVVKHIINTLGKLIPFFVKAGILHRRFLKLMFLPLKEADLYRLFLIKIIPLPVNLNQKKNSILGELLVAHVHDILLVRTNTSKTSITSGKNHHSVCFSYFHYQLFFLWGVQLLS